MVDLTYQDSVAILKLNRSVTNALNLECVKEMSKALHEIKSNPQIHGVVVGSSNEKFFSIGFDIPELFGASEENVRRFYTTFNRTCLDLYTLPKPTVVAITGHAVAGGCIVALCCDYRLISEGRKFMGLNEIKLGVPVPYLGHCVLQSLVGTRQARDLTETGKFYEPERLLEMGVVDEILPLNQVLTKAIEKARGLGSMPADAYGLIKRNRVETVQAQVLLHWEEKEALFIKCWHSDQARKQLREAMAKF